MFATETAKAISTATKANADALRQALAEIFEDSIVGQRSEVRFFDDLLSQMKRVFDTIRLAGLNLTCRIARTHQKPKVAVEDPSSFQCELADLLVVVKYQIEPGVVERKSLFYQVKLCEGDTSKCKIDPNQLELLTSWPRFTFGRKGSGFTSYSLRPKTLELGSYMLMLRAPASGNFIRCRNYFCNLHAYGISPCATDVKKEGPLSVDIASFPYAKNAPEVFFSHIAFEIGEPHEFDPELDGLVGALYRHLGIEEDPPGEFDGFTREVNPEEEPGFALIELTVKRDEDFFDEWRKEKRRQPPVQQPLKQQLRHFQGGS
jgi:hypothetical protein